MTLGQKNEVYGYDISPNVVEDINNKKYVEKKAFRKFFKCNAVDFKATTNTKEAFYGAEYVIICVPTNYDEEKQSFDTSNIEDVIVKVKDICPDATIVIKSTVPVGYTLKMKEKYNLNNVLFCPEFLKEKNALYDSMHPSRIIIGGEDDVAKKYSKILKGCIEDENIAIKYMNYSEAEAVKLFSNSYLALRVAFFNELDTYAELNHLNTKNIIDGVGLDPRIGNFYNNPSFGYGGYCLPKDTKQLLMNYGSIPQNIISAIVNSNQTRKKHIVKMVTDKKPKTIGIYDSDNYRFSAIEEIMNELKKEANIIIYEPTQKELKLSDCRVINDFKEFEKNSDVILANRFDESLLNCKDKVYTRDLYYRD